MSIHPQGDFEGAEYWIKIQLLTTTYANFRESVAEQQRQRHSKAP